MYVDVLNVLPLCFATFRRHVFPISGQELAFARAQGSSYWIVRVYAGSTETAATTMLKLADPL